MVIAEKNTLNQKTVKSSGNNNSNNKNSGNNNSNSNIDGFVEVEATDLKTVLRNLASRHFSP